VKISRLAAEAAGCPTVLPGAYEIATCQISRADAKTLFLPKLKVHATAQGFGNPTWRTATSQCPTRQSRNLDRFSTRESHLVPAGTKIAFSAEETAAWAAHASRMAPGRNRRRASSHYVVFPVGLDLCETRNLLPYTLDKNRRLGKPRIAARLLKLLATTTSFLRQSCPGRYSSHSRTYAIRRTPLSRQPRLLWCSIRVKRKRDLQRSSVEPWLGTRYLTCACQYPQIIHFFRVRPLDAKVMCDVSCKSGQRCGFMG